MKSKKLKDACLFPEIQSMYFRMSVFLHSIPDISMSYWLYYCCNVDSILHTMFAFYKVIHINDIYVLAYLFNVNSHISYQNILIGRKSFCNSIT